jgi:hypothetical protein
LNVETSEIYFKKGEEKRANNGGDEPKWRTLCTYMEKSQRNPYTTITY